MIAVWSELESLCIDRLSHVELTAAVASHREHLPSDLRAGLDELSMEQLRMILLTARLLHLLRNMREKTGAGHGLRADHGC